MKKVYAEEEHFHWKHIVYTVFSICLIIFLSVLIGNNKQDIKELQEQNTTVEINDSRICYSEKCYMDVKNNIQVGPCMMSEVDCSLFENKFALEKEGEQ